MTLVDSSVWIDYFRGTSTPQTDKLDVLLRSEPVAVGDLILTEVLQGFSSDVDYAAAKNALTALTVVEIGGRTAALQAAQNYRILRKAGLTVRKTIDLLIANRCIESGFYLLHMLIGSR